jgi:hypothetical protein
MTPRAQRAVEKAARALQAGDADPALRFRNYETWLAAQARAALIAALEDLLASKDEFPTDAMLNAAQSRLCELAHVTHFNDWHQAEMLRAMLSTLLSDLKGA